jgi:large subunit ribosomal protein L18
MEAKAKRAARDRRHARVRHKIHGTAARPRLSVYRSNRHVYAQVIDDAAGSTLASARDQEVGGADKTARAKALGGLIAERALGAGVDRVVFDRGGRLFHGRVAAVAEGAREGGLQI